MFIIKAVVILILPLVALAAPEGHNIHRDWADLFNIPLNILLENIIDGIRGNLTAKDPYRPDPIALTFDDDTELISGYVNLNDINLEGFTYFSIKVNAVISKSTLGFQFNFNEIHFNTDYDTDVTVASLVPLYGAGNYDFTLKDVGISVGTTANFTFDVSSAVVHLNSVSDFKIQLTLGDSSFSLTGILNDEKFSALFSALLENVIPIFINEHQDFISSILSPFLEEQLNAILPIQVGNTSTTTVAP